MLVTGEKTVEHHRTNIPREARRARSRRRRTHHAIDLRWAQTLEASPMMAKLSLIRRWLTIV
jgi:hypothetical protein